MDCHWPPSSSLSEYSSISSVSTNLIWTCFIDRYSLIAWISRPWCRVYFLFLQEFKLPKDHSSQKPLLFFCPELCDHHYLVDSSGKQPGTSAEESSEFNIVFIITIITNITIISFYINIIDFSTSSISVIPFVILVSVLKHKSGWGI